MLTSFWYNYRGMTISNWFAVPGSIKFKNFESIKPQNQPRSQDLVMSRSALVQWKRKIYDYQQSLRNNPPPNTARLSKNSW